MTLKAGLAFIPVLERDGLHLLRNGAGDQLISIEGVLPLLDNKAAGHRISKNSQLRALLSSGSPLAKRLAQFLPVDARPVRAILFDKSESANWALGWHQDRMICVKQRLPDLEGFGPWSIKQGLQHVEPSFAIIERMRTIRIHLDRVNSENSPLLVAMGSHQLGKIPTNKIQELAQECETYACLAERGDIWVYATPIIHASERSRTLSPRRVLQVDYSADELPGALEWMGV